MRVILSTVAPTFGNLPRREQIIPRYTEVAPRLAQALARATERLLPASLAARCSVPLCVLPHATRHVPALDAPTAAGILTTHRKFPLCNGCPLSPWCEGVWRGYLELHGMAEIVAGARRMRLLRDRLAEGGDEEPSPPRPAPGPPRTSSQGR